MEICRKCSIVYENRTCPLCNLRKHDNLVHDFIESKGRGFVSELVAYLKHRETAADNGAGANSTQQAKHETVKPNVCRGTGHGSCKGDTICDPDNVCFHPA